MQITNHDSANIQSLVNMRDDLSTVIVILERIIPGYRMLNRFMADIGENSTGSKLPYSGLRVGVAAEAYLRDIGSPQSLSVISNALEEGGVEHRSTRLAGSLHSVLKSKPEIFHRFSRGSWGLRSWLEGSPQSSPESRASSTK